MVQQTLEQIGFTKNEAKIYIVLVGLGPQPANIIAKAVGLNRTTTYPILKNLNKKGLVSSFIKGSVKYFSVNDVMNLLAYVERKRRFVDIQRGFVNDIIPKIEALRSPFVDQPKIQYYEGVSGIENIINRSLGAKGPVYSIHSPQKWLRSNMRDFIKDFLGKQSVIGKVPTKILAKDTAESRCFFEDCGVPEVRFVHGDTKLFDNIVYIYDNEVAILSPEKGFEFALLIESEEFSVTQKSLFELAWDGVIVYNQKFDGV